VAEDSERRARLSTPGLADKAQHFSGPRIEGNLIHDFQPRRGFDPKSLNREDDTVRFRHLYRQSTDRRFGQRHQRQD
jgi:hypothetical protein